MIHSCECHRHVSIQSHLQNSCYNVYTFVCVNARQIPSDLKLSPNCIITTLAAERKFTIVNVPMTGGQAYEIVNYWRT